LLNVVLKFKVIFSGIEFAPESGLGFLTLILPYTTNLEFAFDGGEYRFVVQSRGYEITRMFSVLDQNEKINSENTVRFTYSTTKNRTPY
jgi:hypothetical protein